MTTTRVATVKLDADSSGYQRAMKQAQAESERLTKELREAESAAADGDLALAGMVGTAIKYTAAIGAAGAAAATIAAYKALQLLTSALEEASAKQAAQANLTAVLAQQTGSSVDEVRGMVAALNDQAHAIQRVTTASADEITAAQAVMARFDGVRDRIEELTPLLVRYAQFTGQDLPTAALAFSQASEGQVGQLARQVAGVEKLVAANEELDKRTNMAAVALGGFGTGVSVAERHAQNFQGVLDLINKQMPELGTGTNTATGRLLQLENQLADIKATLGEAATPAVIALSDAITPLIEDMGAWAEENEDWIRTGIADAIAGVAPIVADLAARVKSLADSGGLDLIGRGFVDMARLAEKSLLVVVGTLQAVEEGIQRVNLAKVTAANLIGQASDQEVAQQLVSTSRAVQARQQTDQRLGGGSVLDFLAGAAGEANELRKAALNINISADPAFRQRVEAGIREVVEKALEEQQKEDAQAASRGRVARQANSLPRGGGL